LALAAQQEAEKQRLKLQAQLHAQMAARALEGVSPEEARAALAEGRAPVPAARRVIPPAIPTVTAPAAAPPPPTAGTSVPPKVEKVLLDALRVYLGPNQTPEARALAKQMLETTAKANGVSVAHVQSLAHRVRGELGILGVE